MVFIPLLLKKKRKYQSESCLKYFIIQAVSGVFILISLFIFNHFTFIRGLIIVFGFILKLAAAPLHQWIPSIIEGLSWPCVYLLIVPQKIGPIFLLINMEFFIIDNLMLFFIRISAVVGGLGGLIQSSLRKILAYSSISHLGWIIICIQYKKHIWFNYFFIYSFILLTIVFTFIKITVNKIKELFRDLNLIKLLVSLNLLSLRGLPPFTGFLPKIIVIMDLIKSSLDFILLPLLFGTLTSLFFYLRLVFSGFFLSKFSNNYFYYDRNNYFFLLIINRVILLGGVFLLIFILDFKLYKLKAFKALKKNFLKSRLFKS